ncbi:MAG: hypothetical protein C0507_24080 [Cyanobacteria bacterium PR.3.49]|nr:hypothetical protein [Cyanobacteria bacterium PR.3.49]
MIPRHLFVVGAQRSGTTYLYHILNNHPEIEMNHPVKPEPKFFLKPDAEHRLAEYHKTFFSNPSVKYWGDKSASYLEHEEVAQRISKCFPDAIILFTFRNPIERAISHFRYSVDNKVETLRLENVLEDPSLQFREFDRSKISVSPFLYLERSKYVLYLDGFAKYFPKEQMKVLVFEDFVGNEVAVKELYRYLKVHEDFVPDSINQTINFASEQVTPPSPELRSKLARHFAESNAALAERYGVNINNWAKVPVS